MHVCTENPREDETNSLAVTPRQEERKRHFKAFNKRFSDPCFSTVETTIYPNWMCSKKGDIVSSFHKFVHLENSSSTDTEELNHQFRTAPE
jgi:hypothetical protein